MSVQRGSNQTRARLLCAACATVQQRGWANLTLEQVARRAEVSKGGLLHHFPSKQALVEAVVDMLIAEFAAAVATWLADTPPAPGRILRAYVHARLADTSAWSLMLAALADQPTPLTAIRDDARRWQTRLGDDGLPAARVAVIRMAADAYWVDRLIGVAPTEKALDALRDELILLTQKGAQ